jgi:ribosomal protein S18 acetylase RimI-like enzyme
MEKLEIREFRRSDYEDVLELHKVAMLEVGAYKGDGPWNQDLKNIEEAYKNGIFLVGTIDNKIVSMGAVRKINESVCEIKRMRTYPEFQGRGFGKLILNKLIAFAKDNKFKRIILDTSEKQQRAIKLYEKHGFNIFKEEATDLYKVYWYELLLQRL